jgi:hypothetical protein
MRTYKVNRPLPIYYLVDIFVRDLDGKYVYSVFGLRDFNHEMCCYICLYAIYRILGKAIC